VEEWEEEAEAEGDCLEVKEREEVAQADREVLTVLTPEEEADTQALFVLGETVEVLQLEEDVDRVRIPVLEAEDVPEVLREAEVLLLLDICGERELRLLTLRVNLAEAEAEIVGCELCVDVGGKKFTIVLIRTTWVPMAAA
jgi:hypothetical protein